MKRFILICLSIVLSVYIISLATCFSFSKKGENTLPSQGHLSSRTISVFNKDSQTVSEYDLEEYLIGVVSAEMPASYESEALKAQAVAARSYILSRLGLKNPDHPNAVVCTDPSHCKAYLSENEAKEKWGNDWSEKYLKKIQNAVYLTKGEYIDYGGEAAIACFYAASSGKTENAKDVWGGEAPYLKSVDSPQDLTYKDYTSTVTLPASKLCDTLGISSLTIGAISKTEGGSVKEIEIGEKTFSGTQIRSLAGLNSANFELSINENEATFTVYGKGHGVGMSQYGANEMAKQGKSYKEILLHYYSDVTIEKMTDI